MIILRILAVVLYLLKNHPVWSLLALAIMGTPIVLGMGIFLASKKRYLRSIPGLFFSLCLLYFINLFFGFLLYNPLLQITGADGSAVIINSSPTNFQHNDEPVTHFDIRIKPDDSPSEIIASGFDSDAFNIVPYPEDGQYSYPPVGTPFHVRYAPEFPGAFVIIANDDSAYSQSLRCAKEAQAMRQLQAALALEPHNPAYAAEIKQRQQSKCFR